MVGERPVRGVTTFVSLYLLLSLPPFLLLNRDLSAVVTNIALVATLGMTALVLVSGLFVVSEGVERYTRFLFDVSNVYSVAVDLSFVLAAVSWWVVPELAVRLRSAPELRFVLAAVIICQLPMVLFLSVMTAIGKAQEST
jgi:heme/copper-type cytochrome/quinol oxidase subunit 4